MSGNVSATESYKLSRAVADQPNGQCFSKHHRFQDPEIFPEKWGLQQEIPAAYMYIPSICCQNDDPKYGIFTYYGLKFMVKYVGK